MQQLSCWHSHGSGVCTTSIRTMSIRHLPCNSLNVLDSRLSARLPIEGTPSPSELPMMSARHLFFSKIYNPSARLPTEQAPLALNSLIIMSWIMHTILWCTCVGRNMVCFLSLIQMILNDCLLTTQQQFESGSLCFSLALASLFMAEI